MLSSISPFGERARHSRWWLTITAYLLGSVVGGLALGAASAGLGALTPASWRSSGWALSMVACVMLVGLGLDLGVAGLRLPSWRRQVDEVWLTRYRGWVYGAGFGVQLGFGLVTIITSATTYAVAALAALSGHLGVGLALGAVFGLVRALPVLLLVKIGDRQALHRVFALIEDGATPADRVAKAALAVAASALAVAAALA